MNVHVPHCALSLPSICCVYVREGPAAVLAAARTAALCFMIARCRPSLGGAVRLQVPPWRRVACRRRRGYWLLHLGAVIASVVLGCHRRPQADSDRRPTGYKISLSHSHLRSKFKVPSPFKVPSAISFPVSKFYAPLQSVPRLPWRALPPTTCTYYPCPPYPHV